MQFKSSASTVILFSSLLFLQYSISLCFGLQSSSLFVIPQRDAIPLLLRPSTSIADHETTHFGVIKRASALPNKYKGNHYMVGVGSNVLKIADTQRKLSTIVATNIVATIAKKSISDLIATGLGYIIGFGAIALYSPIIIKLLRQKSADGYSTQTWIFSIFGLICSILYPYKKGFPVNTYLELIAVTAQSIGILGLISAYKKHFKGFALAMTAASIAVYTVFTASIPANLLTYIQTLSIISCNYALLPQIYLTFKTKKASWSPITSFLSMSGCAIRIFTTMQLTQDKGTLVGYIIGFIQNFTVLFQIFIYRNNK